MARTYRPGRSGGDPPRETEATTSWRSSARLSRTRARGF